MYNDVVILRKEVHGRDEYGYNTVTVEDREIFCEMKSIGMREKYQALSVGMNPELTIVIPDYYDYDNETRVVIDGVEHDVIRTYRKNKTIEVVITRART